MDADVGSRFESLGLILGDMGTYVDRERGGRGGGGGGELDV